MSEIRWKTRAISAGLLLLPATASATQQSAPPSSSDRSREGDWYISDQTDNNTGEREVYAFQMRLAKDDPDFVTLTLRCSKGKATFFIDWQDVSFPDQVVLTIGPVDAPEVGPSGDGYVFVKSENPVESGLRASPETSAKIVASIGQAKYASLTAHLSTGSRTVGVDVGGTQRAWARVVRHCPLQIMARPAV